LGAFASQSELEIAIMMMRRLKLMAIFCKSQLSDSGELSLFGDLQLRNVHYKANSPETGLVNDFNFFNPKGIEF
jgi:iron complex outermembrane receptor protein